MSPQNRETRPADHAGQCLTIDDQGRDAIDREIDDFIEIDPFNGDPPSRRKDKELAAMLDLLDSLQVPASGKGPQQ